MESQRDQLYCPKCDDTLDCCESQGPTCERHPSGYPTCPKCGAEPRVAMGMPRFKGRDAEADIVPQPYPCIHACWQLPHQGAQQSSGEATP